jgi:pimeloyl-ACP methyl ester carboxylesterase
MAPLADLLAQHFTVIHFDRRGRGDSTDRLSSGFDRESALQREIEDIEALVDEAGGSASLYGISSGAALAMEAAIQLGSKIKKLAMYEVPYNDDEAARQAWKEYTQKLEELLAADRKGDAVALFMMLVGAPPDQVEGMRQHPVALWNLSRPALTTTSLIWGRCARCLRTGSRVTASLVMDGGESFPFMHVTRKLADAIPDAQHRTLEGQTHEVSPDALAPALIQFFKS